MFTGSWKIWAQRFIYFCVLTECIVVSFANASFQLGMQFLVDRTWFIAKYMIYLIHQTIYLLLY
jgi:hypothetical protein